MKRFHVHVSVEDLNQSVAFYSAMFGAEPTVTKSDYAKWAVDDPRINFAISKRDGRKPGVDHVGVQAETADELNELYARLGNANIASQPEAGARCCYAQSDKHWAQDPSGVIWEAFHTMGEIATYGDDTREVVEPAVQVSADQAKTCCEPTCCAS